MKRWKLPKIFEIKSGSDYFIQLCDLNKDTKSFSQRELAKYLEWPMSYIPDLIKNRKPFTVARALEFIQSFKIHPVDAEQLIFIAIASQSKKEWATIQDLRRIKSPVLRENEFPELTIFDFELILICQAVSLLSPKATRSRIEFLLASRRVEAEKASAGLDLLLARGMLKKRGNIFECVLEKGYSNVDLNSGEMKKLMQAFLESIKSFYEEPVQPRTGSSAFVVIDHRRFAEVREKIHTLKNWILEVSAVDAQGVQADNILFQLDLHLLPVFHPDRLRDARAFKD